MKKIIFILLLTPFFVNAQNVVSSPSAGQTFTNGQTINITWNLNSTSPVTIYIQKNNSSWGQTKIAENISDTGSFSWKIPSCDQRPFAIVREDDELQIIISSSGSTAKTGGFKVYNPKPSTPTNFIVVPSETTKTSVRVKLNVPDNCFNTNFSIYDCNTNTEVRTSSRGSSDATEPSIRIYNLTPNTNYSFKVKAQNKSGSSSFSSCIQVKTLAEIPVKPEKPSGEGILFKGQKDVSYSVNNLDNASSYNWKLIPANSGTIKGNTNEILVDWSDDFVGTATLSVNGVNSDNVSGETSESLEILIREKSVIYSSFEFYSEGVTPNSSNPNNYLNKELPVRFKVSVNNELSDNVTTLQGKLTTNTSGVTITDDTVNFGTIGSNLTGWSLDEFEFQVDGTVASGTNLEFQLTLTDGFVSGGPWISHFSFPIQPTTNSTLTLVDNQGNYNGVAEPGENSIKIEPKINNATGFKLDNVRGNISTAQSFLTITSNNKRYNYIGNNHETIEPNQTEVKPELPFEFNYASTADMQELNFDIELQGNLNNENGPLLKWTNSIVLNEGILTAPTLVSVIPENNAIDIALDSNLSFTLNQNITAVSGKNIHIYKDSGSLVTSIDVTGSRVSINNKTVTIDPSSDFIGGSKYYILIDSGAFINSSNSAFEGIGTSNQWTFTTVASNVCTHNWGDVTTYNNGLITAYGIVTIEGKLVTEEDKVGVFSGTELRSIGNVTISDNVAYSVLLIENTGTETFTFKIWDSSECEELSVIYSIEATTGETVGLPPNYLPINAQGSTASLNEETLSNSFTIYPNPTKSILNIENTSSFKISLVEVFNILGKRIVKNKSNRTSIDISKYANGIYFLKINTDKGSVTKKIIKE